MKNTIYTPIALGLMASLALIFSLVFVSLVQLQSTNRNMEKLVDTTNIKTAAANEMRDAIRLRSESIKIMMLTNDILERDEEYQRFTSYAGRYRLARENLARPGIDTHELSIIKQLDQLNRSSQPYSDYAANLLLGDSQTIVVDEALEKVAVYQKGMHDAIEELIALERTNSEQSLKTSQNHYAATRRLLFTLSGIALLFTLLVSRTVNIRTSARNRQLAYQASHDALTGLINRNEFECRVDRAIEQARTQSATHALLHLDLDQFKVIDDSCGHLAGNEFLRLLSSLLLSSVRQRDTLSRLGGDEYGMLLENCPLEKAIEIANELLIETNKFRFSWREKPFTINACIGVAIIDHSSIDLASVMSAADSACYIARESDRDRVQIAQHGDRHLQDRHGEIQWIQRLRKALGENRFVLYFQPIVTCAGKPGQDKHIEILLRMIDEDGTIIAPGAFLPACEKFNISTRIDRWVISHAMEWLASNSAQTDCPVTLFVNLSAQSIGNPEILNFIIEETDKTGVDATKIVFGVTETDAVANITSATGFMLTLRGCGFRFSLDNFGSGLSSFTYLKKLPVEFLKINGAFVRDILSDPVDHALVKSINKLGHLLGKRTIAEFVETLELAEELRVLGIDFTQGYVYAKPRPLHDFSRTLRPHLVLVSSRKP